jgi:Helix-turn-helix domain
VTAHTPISVKFGDEILEHGFTVVPNLILDSYTALRITTNEMLFIIHVWQYWWTERSPHPSLSRIAEKMGVSWRQCHRYAKSLEDKEYLLIRERYLNGLGQQSNEYDFSPLIRAVSQTPCQK